MTLTLQSLSDAIQVEEVGGKAAALGALLRAGFPVPAGFVVPVAVYREHAARAFAGLAASAPPEQKRAALLAVPLDPTFAARFRETWDRLMPGPAAVRSSATLEDSARASFAGQFHTALGVKTAETGLSEVRACWVSMFEVHAKAYSDHISGGNDAGMAVVVQEMLCPQFSGVAFTHEPVVGSDRVYYAEWVEGLGEELVSGRGVAGRVWFTLSGLVLRIDYLGGEMPPPHLWTALAGHLVCLPSLLGGPQDVEWSWEEGTQLSLLQSRPITAVAEGEGAAPPPWVLPGTPAEGWTEEQRRLFDSWDEYNQDPVSPLAFDLYEAAIWQASLDMLASEEHVLQVDQVAIRVDEVPVAVDPAARVRGMPAAYPQGRNEARVQEMMVQWEGRVREVQAEVAGCASLPDDRLLALLDRVAGWYRDANVTRLLQMNERIEGEDAARAVLREILTPMGGEPDDAVERLCAGLDHETHRRVQALHLLAQRLNHEGRSREWQDDLKQFCQRYGYVEGFGSLQSLEAQVEQLAVSGTADPVAEARSRAGALVEAVLARLENSVRDQFDKALREMHHWVALREDSKARVHLPWPLLQALMSEAGQRLVSRGKISTVDDMQLLTWEELQAALAGSAPESRVLARRAALLAWKAEHRSWLPPGFLGATPATDGNVLRGLSGSRGVAEGRGRIVRGPEEFGHVTAGDIVVAYSTNPVWTQLFSRIAGIAVENGSRLSHAAVVAREFGIPAVVGVPGLMVALSDGERLRIDGDAGEIIRIDWEWPGEDR